MRRALVCELLHEVFITHDAAVTALLAPEHAAAQVVSVLVIT